MTEKSKNNNTDLADVWLYRQKLRSGFTGVSEKVASSLEKLATKRIRTNHGDQHPTISLPTSPEQHNMPGGNGQGAEGGDPRLTTDEVVQTLCRELISMKMDSQKLLEHLLDEKRKDDPTGRMQAARLRDAQKFLIKPPEPFSRPTATRSTARFLEEYQQYASNITDDPAIIIKGLESYLKDEALATYKTFLIVHPEKASFREMAKELQKEYDTLSPEERLRTYAHRKQGDSEAVTDYARDITLLMATSDLSETTKLDFFINNLLPKYRKLVISKAPNTIKNAVTAAQEVEATLQAQKNEFDTLKDMVLKQQKTQDKETVEMIRSVSWHDRSRGRTQRPLLGRSYDRRGSRSPYRPPRDQSYDRNEGYSPYQRPRGQSPEGRRSYSRDSSWSSNSRPSSPETRTSRDGSYDRYSSRDSSRNRDSEYHNYYPAEPREAYKPSGRYRDYQTSSAHRNSYRGYQDMLPRDSYRPHERSGRPRDRGDREDKYRSTRRPTPGPEKRYEKDHLN